MSDGDDGKREGMDRVERGTDPAWRRAADAAVVKAARLHRTITTDNVVELIPETVSTHEMRALGPVMIAAARDGVIRKAIRLPVNCATRPSNHSRPLQVWDSLLYRGDGA